MTSDTGVTLLLGDVRMPIDVAVGRDFDPPLTERELRSCCELLTDLRAIISERLPVSLELVDVDLEVIRRSPLPSVARRRRAGR